MLYLPKGIFRLGRKLFLKHFIANDICHLEQILPSFNFWPNRTLELFHFPKHSYLKYLSRFFGLYFQQSITKNPSKTN